MDIPKAARIPTRVSLIAGPLLHGETRGPPLSRNLAARSSHLIVSLIQYSRRAGSVFIRSTHNAALAMHSDLRVHGAS